VQIPPAPVLRRALPSRRPRRSSTPGKDAGIGEKLPAQLGQRVTVTGTVRVASRSTRPLVAQARHIDAAQAQDLADVIVNDRCRIRFRR